MSDRLVFVDTETTGLDPTRHEVWEIAIYSLERGWDVLQRRPTYLNRAEPEALAVNGYYENRALASRHRRRDVPVEIELLEDEPWAWRVARRLSGAALAGIGPWYDSEMLKFQLRRLGQAPAWDHRLVDCKALAVGAIRSTYAHSGSQTFNRSLSNDVMADVLGRVLEGPPFSTQDVADVLGVDRSQAHTSFWDVVTAVRFYEKAMGVEFDLEVL